MRKILTLTLPAMIAMSAPVYAQGQAVNADDILQKDAGPAPSQNAQAAPTADQNNLEATLKAAQEENKDEAILAKKKVLAKEMHKIRSTRSQVDSAVRRAATMLPENERAPFINVMSGMLNYNAIERISMDAMVETYTLRELEVMVDFYSQPEALSASIKMGVWAQKVQPEIARMIDKAILRIRTGQ